MHIRCNTKLHNNDGLKMRGLAGTQDNAFLTVNNSHTEINTTSKRHAKIVLLLLHHLNTNTG